MNEHLTQDELEVRNMLEAFFVRVSELPMIEQVKILRDFQDFLAEQREKGQHNSDEDAPNLGHCEFRDAFMERTCDELDELWRM